MWLFRIQSSQATVEQKVAMKLVFWNPSTISYLLLYKKPLNAVNKPEMFIRLASDSDGLLYGSKLLAEFWRTMWSSCLSEIDFGQQNIQLHYFRAICHGIKLHSIWYPKVGSQNWDVQISSSSIIFSLLLWNSCARKPMKWYLNRTNSDICPQETVVCRSISLLLLDPFLEFHGFIN